MRAALALLLMASLAGAAPPTDPAEAVAEDALALYRAGRFEEALVRWTDLARLSEADRAEAEEHLAALRVRLAPRPPDPVPQAPPTVHESPPPPPPNRLPAWLGFGAAAGLGIAGGVLWIVAAKDLDRLDASLAQANATGLVSGVSQGDASRRLDAINAERATSIVLFAGAAASVAFGAVWLATHVDPSPLAVTPIPAGVLVLLGGEL